MIPQTLRRRLLLAAFAIALFVFNSIPVFAQALTPPDPDDLTPGIVSVVFQTRTGTKILGLADTDNGWLSLDSEQIAWMKGGARAQITTDEWILVNRLGDNGGDGMIVSPGTYCLQSRMNINSPFAIYNYGAVLYEQDENGQDWAEEAVLAMEAATEHLPSWAKSGTC